MIFPFSVKEPGALPLPALFICPFFLSFFCFFHLFDRGAEALAELVPVRARLAAAAAELVRTAGKRRVPSLSVRKEIVHREPAPAGGREVLHTDADQPSLRKQKRTGNVRRGVIRKYDV